MKKFAIVALVMGLFTGSAMATEVQSVISCKTGDGVNLSVTWEPKSGNVVLNHGDYIATRNTNDMGWSKIIRVEVEDTEVYLDKGDIHNIISVTDTGNMKVVSLKQSKVSNPDDILSMDACIADIRLNVTDAFLANMINVDDE